MRISIGYIFYPIQGYFVQSTDSNLTVCFAFYLNRPPDEKLNLFYYLHPKNAKTKIRFLTAHEVLYSNFQILGSKT